jgi:hypothetical protein
MCRGPLILSTRGKPLRARKKRSYWKTQRKPPSTSHSFLSISTTIRWRVSRIDLTED